MAGVPKEAIKKRKEALGILVTDPEQNQNNTHTHTHTHTHHSHITPPVVMQHPGMMGHVPLGRPPMGLPQMTGGIPGVPFPVPGYGPPPPGFRPSVGGPPMFPGPRPPPPAGPSVPPPHITGNSISSGAILVGNLGRSSNGATTGIPPVATVTAPVMPQPAPHKPQPVFAAPGEVYVWTSEESMEEMRARSWYAARGGYKASK